MYMSNNSSNSNKQTNNAISPCATPGVPPPGARTPMVFRGGTLSLSLYINIYIYIEISLCVYICVYIYI